MDIGATSDWPIIVRITQEVEAKYSCEIVRKGIW